MMASTLTFEPVSAEKALSLLAHCRFLQRTSRTTQVIDAESETRLRIVWQGAGLQVRLRAIVEVVGAFAEGEVALRSVALHG